MRRQVSRLVPHTRPKSEDAWPRRSRIQTAFESVARMTPLSRIESRIESRGSHDAPHWACAVCESWLCSVQPACQIAVVGSAASLVVEFGGRPAPLLLVPDTRQVIQQSAVGFGRLLCAAPASIISQSLPVRCGPWVLPYTDRARAVCYDATAVRLPAYVLMTSQFNSIQL